MHKTGFPGAQCVLLLTPLLLFNPQLVMADDQMEIEMVTVHGQRIEDRFEAERALTPGGVTVVDLADLQDRSVGSLADLLRYVPGVWSASSYGSDSVFFSSRGSNLDATDFDSNGVKLLVDGLPVTTADGNNHNRIIDPLSARYASIAKGANALTYGASTLGGAINFISPNAKNSEPFSLSLTTGSHGLAHGRITTGWEFNEQWDAQLTIESKERNGYRDHNDQSRLGLYSNIGWQLSESIGTRFYLTALNNDLELPGSLTAAEMDADRDQASSVARSGDYQKNVETFRFANKTTFILSQNSTLEVGFSYEEQSLYHPIVDRILVDFGGPEPQEVFSLLIDTDHQDIGGMVRYNLLSGEHNLLFGLNFGRNKVEGGNYRNLGGKRNGLTTDVDNDAHSIEAYAVDRWSLNEKWTLVYGLQAVSAKRHVRNTTVSSGALREPSDQYDSINPRLGVIYQLTPGVTAYANVSRLFEAPTNFELEDETAASNATLDALNGVVFEIGSRGTGGNNDLSWHWDVSLYHANINNEILSVDDPLAPGTSLTTNVDETIHSGIELLTGVTKTFGGNRLETVLSLTGNYFRFDGDAHHDDNHLPGAPDYVLRAESMYRMANGFYAGPTLDVIGERYSDFANTYEIDSYHLLGLRAGYKADQWEIFVEGKNLEDKTYVATHSVNNISAANAAILNPGEPRSIYIGFRLSY